MLYNKKNYILIGVSVALIVIGLLLMSGGGSSDGISFETAIFSNRRILFAPIVCLAGFLLMIYAILVKPSNEKKGE